MSMTLSYASPFVDAVVKSHSTNSAGRPEVSASIHMCRSVDVDGVRPFSSHLLCSPQDTDWDPCVSQFFKIHSAPEAMSLQHRPFLVAGDVPAPQWLLILVLSKSSSSWWLKKVSVAILFWRSRHHLVSPHSQVETVMALGTSRVQTVIISQASLPPQD